MADSSMAKLINDDVYHTRPTQGNGVQKDFAIQGSFEQLFSEPTEQALVLLPQRQSTPDVSLFYTSKKHAAVRTEEYLFSQLIPYIGNKRKLLWLIAEAINTTGVGNGVFVDFFAGSSVVARMAKVLGFSVLANDWEPYSKVINHCYIQCNTMPSFERVGGPESAVKTLNHLEPIEDYFAKHLCPKDDNHPDPDKERMFFTRANGSKIDAMREQICQWETKGLLSEDERAILLACFVYSVSYVSNTSGVFKGFHRGWGGNTKTALYRILSNIELRLPVLYDNGQRNASFQLNAQALATHLRETKTPVDIAYLDPPYNQHPYGSNYHVLNTLVLWDKPALSPGISGRDKSAIRTDWRIARRSAYNYATALEAFKLLIETIEARYILTSYSTDGNIPLYEMLAAAATRGAISCVKRPYKRYRVSSQRMSAKPMNVEFVLVIDTHRNGKHEDANRLYNDIINSEQEALSSHREAQQNGAASFAEELFADWGKDY